MPEFEPLRYRQVHLDFHTSEKIPNVGDKFNPKQFQSALLLGHVNSITLFSKCHHGLSYHDTTVGIRHPGLNFDLLRTQIVACREIGVKTPIYISAGFDEYILSRHPEWGVKGPNGETFPPLQPGFKPLCFNTPYLHYLCAQIEEVVDLFNAPDGIFLDIIAPRACYCRQCLEGMKMEGMDPKNKDEVIKYGYMVLQRYYERTTKSAKKNMPNRRVFHNSGHISKGAKDVLKWNTHLELESLPTGGWGYDHFPISAKYAATTGMDVLGITGKFHTTWGEFGGFKRKNALRYECSAMLAFGSKCSVGDQLHPNGVMNRDTYDLIGAAYAEVEAKEPWCKGAVPVNDVALVSTEALFADKPGGPGRTNASEEGAARMLLELHVPFDVIDLDHELESYRLLVLPDEITLSGTFLHKVRRYLKAGGKLLLSGCSGMNPKCNGFAIDFGLKVEGRSESDPDYLTPTDLSPTPPVRSPIVIHDGSWNVTPIDDAITILATKSEPYFNRDWDHFCSHQHTPDEKPSPYPAIVSNGDIAYFAHNIFTRYRLYGQPLYRDMVKDAMHSLISPSVIVDLPTTARISLMMQESENRYVLHLLFGVPVRRGADQGTWGGRLQAVDIIEDLYPLYNVACALKLREKVCGVICAPDGAPIDFQSDNGWVRFTLPKLDCHAMVEIRI